ncbi:MAG: hypothetical protein HND48_06780 [Chloroflexi bacterium]|nr:hypothetical protein [Chloroflexota bacterium]
MNLDALTLSALLDELMDTIVGGRIQDAIDVNDDSVGLEIYADHRRHYLYLSADPQTPRVHLVTDKLRRGRSTPTQPGCCCDAMPRVERSPTSHNRRGSACCISRSSAPKATAR